MINSGNELSDVVFKSDNLSELTLCITCFNKFDFLDRCKKIVLAFTFLGGKVVIVDDGSDDGSGERLQNEFAQIDNLLLVRTENKGSGAARNQCLDHVETEFLCFLDIDDKIDISQLDSALANMNLNNVDLYQFQYILESGVGVNPILEPGLYTLESSAGGVTRSSFLESLGYWRYIYRTNFIREKNIRFTPTFSQMDDKVFILDDYLWLIHIFAVDITVQVSNSKKPFYEYNFTYTPEYMKRYLAQVILFPKAILIFIDTLENCCHSHNNEWLRQTLSDAVTSHVKFLRLGQVLSCHRELSRAIIKSLSFKKSYSFSVMLQFLLYLANVYVVILGKDAKSFARALVKKIGLKRK